MEDLLRPQQDHEHPLYARLRDRTDPHSVERREFFAALWRKYEPFAPRKFPEKLQKDFHQRWWEMYLVVRLLHLEIIPRQSNVDKGPDVTLDVGGRAIFVEATAPRIGTKSDRVPEPVHNGVADFPERECLLRFTQALRDKSVKLHEYVNKKVIPREACALIALSASDLNQFGGLLDSGCPAPLKVLAAAGPMVLRPSGAGTPYLSRRSILPRDSGSEVDAALFENPDFSIVAGVLYSRVDLWNATLRPEDSLSLFVNPSAEHPIPEAFRKRFKCWVQEKSSGTTTVWSSSPPIGPPYPEFT